LMLAIIQARARQLDEAIVLVVALMVDSTEPQRMPLRIPAPPDRPSVSIGLDLAIAVGMLPGAALGFGLASEIRIPPFWPVALWTHAWIEEPEARYLQVEARPHPRQRQLHVPAWTKPSPHLAAPELDLRVSMSREGWPAPRKGDPLTRRFDPLTPDRCTPRPERCRRSWDRTILHARSTVASGGGAQPCRPTVSLIRHDRCSRSRKRYISRAEADSQMTRWIKAMRVKDILIPSLRAFIGAHGPSQVCIWRHSLASRPGFTRPDGHGKDGTGTHPSATCGKP
jgi:hypothetical protein